MPGRAAGCLYNHLIYPAALHAQHGPASGLDRATDQGMDRGARVDVDQFVEGIILLKAFQYLFMATGFIVSMLFLLLLAIAEPMV